jgi:YidC/Oxa1 family membrane protein insertase
VDNRRLLIAFLLSMIVIGVWFWLFPPPKPAAQAPPARAAQTPAATAEATPGSPAIAGVPGVPAATPAITPPAAPVEAVAAAAEERVTLASGRTRAVFTNRGAQLVSMLVPEKENPKSGTLEMVRQRAAAGLYPYALVTRALRPHPLDSVLFRAEKGADGRSVTFRYSGPQGVAEKRFRFDERGLLDVDVRLPGRADWGVLVGPGVRNPTAEEIKSRFEHRRAVYRSVDDVKLLDPSSAFATVDVTGRSLRWAGLEDTYFLSAQIPKAPLDKVVLQPLLVQAGDGGPTFAPVPSKDDISKEQKDLPREYALVMQPAGDTLSLTSYWGSKNYERLKALPYGLEGTVELGKFGFLARPLLAGLHWIHDNVVANYGWAIILMTVLIKIVLLPVTHTSTMQMRKMQELNPKIQGIRDRYRTKLRDKQGKPILENQRKMNEEVMAVYKVAGVNPASGCFPLVLQMPILFAFYGLLSTAAELRKAPWMFWIKDLSVSDPYLVLPIVMGVTQFLQVRMGPQAGDPMQRRMFQLMPIGMTFLFLGFPSGLVLYWLTNNILTILQLQVYNRYKKANA